MADDRGPIIVAQLPMGPLSGTTADVPAVEGRLPKTIDIRGADDKKNRYCLAEWEQCGHTAVYSFLYEV